MKKRLDQLLSDKGLFPSRTRAQAAILAGLVFVNNEKITTAGQLFAEEMDIQIKGTEHPYVGRGGMKLEKALKEFALDVKDKIALDIGASTGGFTDCLLQNGTAKVYAIDVGYGQLAWKLRQDNRVKVLERTNIRHLTPEELYKDPKDKKANLAVIDVSFISLSKVLPAIYNLLENGATVVALIKPQFEAQREQVGKGGIVKDRAVHAQIIEKVQIGAQAAGFEVGSVIPSPITGADGNQEFLLCLKKS